MEQKREYRKDYNLITRENFDDFLECYKKNGCKQEKTLQILNINQFTFLKFINNNPDLKDDYHSIKKDFKQNKFENLDDNMYDIAMTGEVPAISIYMHKTMIERGYDAGAENNENENDIIEINIFKK
jgi:hypothetical protein